MSLTRGTKENVDAVVTDKQGLISSVAGATFDVKDSTGADKYTAQACTVSGLIAYCLLDTSAAHAGGIWDTGRYRLYLNFTVGSEVVKKGPLEFVIVE